MFIYVLVCSYGISLLTSGLRCILEQHHTVVSMNVRAQEGGTFLNVTLHSLLLSDLKWFICSWITQRASRKRLPLNIYTCITFEDSAGLLLLNLKMLPLRCGFKVTFNIHSISRYSMYQTRCRFNQPTQLQIYYTDKGRKNRQGFDVWAHGNNISL